MYTDVHAPQTWYQCRFLIHPDVLWSFTSPEIRKHLKTSETHTDLKFVQKNQERNRGFWGIPEGFWAECGFQSSWKNRKFLAVHESAWWFFTDFHHAFTMLSPNCWALQSGSQDMLLGEVLTLVTARHSAISFRPFALLIGSFNACKKHACQLGSSSHS
jgi:hypothetical protein